MLSSQFLVLVLVVQSCPLLSSVQCVTPVLSVPVEEPSHLSSAAPSSLAHLFLLLIRETLLEGSPTKKPEREQIDLQAGSCDHELTPLSSFSPLRGMDDL